MAGLDRRHVDLYQALRSAYVNREDLEMLLDIELDMNLNDICDNLNLRITIYNVVKVAKSQGWIDKFIEAAREDRPDNEALKEWAKRYHALKQNNDRSVADSISRWQLLDSLYFDLKAVRAAIRHAMLAPEGRVLGFGVTYSDLVFVGKLRDLLKNVLEGETQYKDPLSLKPELDKVSRKVHQVRGYLRDLDSANVLCIVLVDAVPHDHISDFWIQVCQEFGEATRHFVLLLAGDESTVFPHGVTVLPSPRFDLDDVAQWAEDTIIQIKWPHSLAAAWTDLLRADALHDGQLDVRTLYEAMDRSIKEIRFNPDKFRFKLENRTWHAISASG